jgi:hypothetical protein
MYNIASSEHLCRIPRNIIRYPLMAITWVSEQLVTIKPYRPRVTGRDWLVARAVTGGHWKSLWWKADVEYRTDLLPEGSDGK